MYDPVSDTPALVRNSNLNEELGQVRHCVPIAPALSSLPS